MNYYIKQNIHNSRSFSRPQQFKKHPQITNTILWNWSLPQDWMASESVLFTMTVVLWWVIVRICCRIIPAWMEECVTPCGTISPAAAPQYSGTALRGGQVCVSCPRVRPRPRVKPTLRALNVSMNMCLSEGIFIIESCNALIHRWGLSRVQLYKWSLSCSYGDLWKLERLSFVGFATPYVLVLSVLMT